MPLSSWGIFWIWRNHRKGSPLVSFKGKCYIGVYLLQFQADQQSWAWAFQASCCFLTKVIWGSVDFGYVLECFCHTSYYRGKCVFISKHEFYNMTISIQWTTFSATHPLPLPPPIFSNRETILNISWSLIFSLNVSHIQVEKMVYDAHRLQRAYERLHICSMCTNRIYLES